MSILIIAMTNFCAVITILTAYDAYVRGHRISASLVMLGALELLVLNTAGYGA